MKSIKFGKISIKYPSIILKPLVSPQNSIHFQASDNTFFRIHSGGGTPLRWHVQAYCEHSNDYRDFVLSRIHDIPEVNNCTIYGKASDTLWNTEVNIELVPDAHFNEKQKSVIEKDYGMSDGVLSIATNTSLIRYVLDSYNIYIHLQKSNPQCQQIMLGNMDELRPYLLF